MGEQVRNIANEPRMGQQGANCEQRIPPTGPGVGCEFCIGTSNILVPGTFTSLSSPFYSTARAQNRVVALHLCHTLAGYSLDFMAVMFFTYIQL